MPYCLAENSLRTSIPISVLLINFHREVRIPVPAVEAVTVKTNNLARLHQPFRDPALPRTKFGCSVLAVESFEERW
jgi:hypothetical protein